MGEIDKAMETFTEALSLSNIAHMDGYSDSVSKALTILQIVKQHCTSAAAA